MVQCGRLNGDGWLMPPIGANHLVGGTVTGIRARNNSKQKIMKARSICQESSSEYNRLDKHCVLNRLEGSYVHVYNDVGGSEMEKIVAATRCSYTIGILRF